MNYTAKQYSQALLECCKKAKQEDIDAMVARLETLLKKQGKRSLLAPIIKQVRDADDKANGVTHVKVTTGADTSVNDTDISKIVRDLGKEEPQITIEHDDTIIAGVRVLVDSQWYIDTTTNQSIKKLSDQLHTL
ncbi:MAG: F0F1 ATP synthase subunit delta [bacterium]|nr:F0F1 ATP synthase subunit delta [bacterium]